MTAYTHLDHLGVLGWSERVRYLQPGAVYFGPRCPPPAEFAVKGVVDAIVVALR